MSHTPGPWVYVDDFSVRVPLDDDLGMVIADCDGNDIVETEANGRLIAAAPDLLEACEMALEFISNGTLRPDYHNPYALMVSLQSMIRKARGQT